MQSTSQQTPRPPCACQQQFGGALPFLLAVLGLLLLVDRWKGRRKKKPAELQGTDNGVQNGENR
jgi:hypothetical protein